MNIDSKEMLLGYPILKMRELVRRIGGSGYETEKIYELISEVLDIGASQSKAVFCSLRSNGYLQTMEIAREQKCWVTSIKGNALAMASAAKPILRKTADKKLHGFMERVKEVNANDHYLYRVRKVIVFGSYLSTKERLGDIDIAIELVPKEGEPKRHGELTRERAREARDKGRRFPSFIDELYWAHTEVKRFLKSR